METSDTTSAQGKVYLVGAGPGEPKLITIRGVECLQRADVILYDYLVNPLILKRYAPAHAEIICLGRHGKGHSRVWSQEEIHRQLVALAGSGKTVVRLKGGDPAIFARGAEEAEELAKHGIAFEIVPGITAALAAGSFAGIPVTHRDWASAVALVTGQEDEQKAETALDFRALAAFPGTLVFYMGVTTARRWTTGLMEAGKAPATPIAIVRRCSFPDQTTIHCTLETVADQLVGIRPPAIVVVGDVTRLAERLNWFEKRPLFGCCVLVTRPADQSDEIADLLGEMGAEVLEQPAIEIGPPPDWSPVDRALSRLAEFDWLVFSSVNGVRYFRERLWETGRDLRALGSAKLASVGTATSAALEQLHLRVDLQPNSFRAEALAEALVPHAPGKRFLILRASRGRDVLVPEITRAGGFAEQVVVYESRDVTTPNPDVLASFDDDHVDWVTVTSSAIARSVARLFGERLRVGRCKLASISPITSGTLREMGLEPAVEADSPTTASLVSAICGYPRGGTVRLPQPDSA